MTQSQFLAVNLTSDSYGSDTQDTSKQQRSGVWQKLSAIQLLLCD